MASKRFAERTKVPVAHSKGEVEDLLKRYGAKSFMSGQTAAEAMIAFEAKDRRVMFRLPMPDAKKFSGDKFAQEERRLWRALVMCIKAKLEAVESGIATFEDEFLAYVVMPDGQTVGDHIKPRIATSYRENKMIPFFGGDKKP